MSYLVSQMWLCLLLAGILGFLLGWLLKQLGFGSKLEELENSWKSRFSGVESERDKLRANIGDLTSQAKKLETDWSAKYATLTGDRDKLQVSLADWDKKYGALDADWKAKWAALEGDKKKLMADLDACGKKWSASEADLGSWKLKFAELEKASVAGKADYTSLTAKLAAGATALAAAEAARLALAADAKKQMDAEHAKHAAALADWNGRWSHLEKERDGLKSQLSASDHQWQARWKEEQDNHTAALGDWNIRWIALGKERDGLKAQVDEEKGKLTAADAQWKSRWIVIEKERDTFKANLDAKGKSDQEEHAKHAAAEANWKSRWAALEKERDSLKAQLDATGKHDAVLQGQLKEANTRLATADADWKNRWMILEKERDTLKGSLDSGATRISLLEAEIDKLKKNTPVVGDIEDIEGIGPSYGAKLRGVGLAWIKTFLERCANKIGREEVAASSGINETLILTWANMADLLRLWGVTPDWAELLEAAGVDTVKEIKHRVPANLHAKLTEVNAGKNLARTVPSLEMVTSWVEQAKAIPHVITH